MAVYVGLLLISDGKNTPESEGGALWKEKNHFVLIILLLFLESLEVKFVSENKM